MERRNKLKLIEEKVGSLEQVIPQLLDEHGGSQKHVADALGVSTFTISRWLKDNNYISITKYIKDPQCQN